MAAKTIGFVGGGRIARIMLGGFQRAGKIPEHVVVSDQSADVLDRLKGEFPEIKIFHNENKHAAEQDIVFVAVHPPAMAAVLGEIQSSLKAKSVLVSLAPRVTIAKIGEMLRGFERSVRMIPNAPSIVNKGYNPVSFSPALTGKEKDELLELLRTLGECPEVPEEHLEAYAIITAMGPTYLWFQLYELQEIAQSFGLTRRDAETGIAKMVKGAVNTMYRSGLTPEKIMDLIPVRPLGEEEANIRNLYRSKLGGLFKKLKG
jgi:pyrroline-5-carboxylate reductase